MTRKAASVHYQQKNLGAVFNIFLSKATFGLLLIFRSKKIKHI